MGPKCVIIIDKGCWDSRRVWTEEKEEILQGKHFRIMPKNIGGLYLVFSYSSNLDLRRIVYICKQGQISK